MARLRWSKSPSSASHDVRQRCRGCRQAKIGVRRPAETLSPGAPKSTEAAVDKPMAGSEMRGPLQLPTVHTAQQPHGLAASFRASSPANVGTLSAVSPSTRTNVEISRRPWEEPFCA